MWALGPLGLGAAGVAVCVDHRQCLNKVDHECVNSVYHARVATGKLSMLWRGPQDVRGHVCPHTAPAEGVEGSLNSAKKPP